MKTFFIVWGVFLAGVYSLLGLIVLLRHSPDWVTGVFASLVVTAILAAIVAIES